MVVTDKQLKWLDDIISGRVTKRDNPHKWSVYRKRIRERIDHQLDNLVWLAENAPEILKDEEYEIQEFGAIIHRRLKKLMLTIKLIYPENDPVLIKMSREIMFSS